jgi:hypothetical protein
MRMSHEAVSTDRAMPSQTRMMFPARTAMWSSVACTAWPPGTQRAPGMWPASYSSAVLTSSRATFSCWRRAHRDARCSGETKRTPSSAATRVATTAAAARPRLETGGAHRLAPRSSSRPASVQPIVPFSRARMEFGRPIRRSDSAPM